MIIDPKSFSDTDMSRSGIEALQKRALFYVPAVYLILRRNPEYTEDMIRLHTVEYLAGTPRELHKEQRFAKPMMHTLAEAEPVNFDRAMAVCGGINTMLSKKGIQSRLGFGSIVASLFVFRQLKPQMERLHITKARLLTEAQHHTTMKMDILEAMMDGCRVIFPTAWAVLAALRALTRTDEELALPPEHHIVFEGADIPADSKSVQSRLRDYPKFDYSQSPYAGSSVQKGALPYSEDDYFDFSPQMKL